MTSFYRLKPAEAGKVGVFNLIPSSGCSAVAEGCVAGKVAGQEVSRCFKFLADEAEPKKPSSHCVFGVLVLLGFRACRADVLCHLAEGEAKLNVALELSGVKAVLSAAGGRVELEKAELDRALCEGRVVVCTPDITIVI